MKNKFNIVVLKIGMLFPLGIAMAVLISGFTNIDWLWAAVGGLVFAAGFVFWNVFEYDKFDLIKDEDYLESTHSITLPNTEAILEMIQSQARGVFSDVILTDKKDDQGYWRYDIKSSRYPSFMRVDFNSNDIVVTIKPKYLTFIPDFAINYRIIHRLRRTAEKLTSTTGDII